MTEPLFSLVLPVKNGMPGLKRALEAVSRQTCRDFELLVQDGGSTDGSIEFLNEAAPPEMKLAIRADGGIGEAYNNGFRRCSGRLVVALACDEWLEPEALATFEAWHRQHPNAAYVYGGARLWRSETEMHSELHPGPFDFLKFVNSQYCPTTGGFYNRHVIGKDFHLDAALKTCPDFDFFIRLAQRFSAKELIAKPEILLNAQIDRSSRSYRVEFFGQVAADRQYILERFFVQQGNSPLIDLLRRQSISAMYLQLARALLGLAGETQQVHRFIIAAARSYPGSPDVAALVAQCRGLCLNNSTGEVGRLQHLQPEQPPSAAGPVEAAVGMFAIRSREEWQAVGAEVEMALRVTTGPGPWNYAAELPLGFVTPGLWYWVRLTVEVEAGQVSIAVMTSGGLLRGETLLNARPAAALVTLPVLAGDIAVLFRNGGIEGRSSLKVQAVEALCMTAP